MTEPDSGTDSISNRPVFTGSSEEYFRIWIVNMLLSIVTLGIYSAWATVRNRRYLYGNTEFDGSRFDFHGQPLAILKGRIIAVLAFIAYAFGGDFHFAIPLVALFVMMAAFPWVIVSALRFRLSNTSWKSLRFGFSATPKQAYSTLFFPVAILILVYASSIFVFQIQDNGADPFAALALTGIWGLIFLGVSIWAIPALNYRMRNLVMNHVHFGDHRFNADLHQRVFFTAYLKVIGISIVAIFAAGLVLVAIAVVLAPVFSGFDSDLTLGFSIAASYAVIILVYLLPFAFWQVVISNHVISSLRLESVKFRMSMKVWDYWLLLATNAVAAVLSLGLAIPWAKVRVLRYRLSCLSIDGPVNGFTGSQKGIQSASGDELGEAFDIDIGF